MIRLSLPLPPSVNHTYLHTRRGVILSERARSYRDAVGWQCKGLEVPAAGPLVLRVWIGGRGDLDNRLKQLQDAIAAGLGFNDARIAELHVWRVKGQKGATVELAWEVRT